jgi:hypothetical protein
VDKHYDPREIQLRIDVAGKPEKRDEPGERQYSGDKKHRAAVFAARPDEVHGFTWTLHFSGRP